MKMSLQLSSSLSSTQFEVWSHLRDMWMTTKPKSVKFYKKKRQECYQIVCAIPPACLLRLREINIWFVGKKNPQKFGQSISLSCDSGTEETPLPFLPSKKTNLRCLTFVQCRCIVHHCR